MRQSDTSPTERVPSNPCQTCAWQAGGSAAAGQGPVQAHGSAHQVFRRGRERRTGQVCVAWVYRRYSKDHNLYRPQTPLRCLDVMHDVPIRRISSATAFQPRLPSAPQ